MKHYLLLPALILIVTSCSPDKYEASGLTKARGSKLTGKWFCSTGWDSWELNLSETNNVVTGSGYHGSCVGQWKFQISGKRKGSKAKLKLDYHFDDGSVWRSEIREYVFMKWKDSGIAAICDDRFALSKTGITSQANLFNNSLECTPAGAVVHSGTRSVK